MLSIDLADHTKQVGLLAKMNLSNLNTATSTDLIVSQGSVLSSYSASIIIFTKVLFSDLQLIVKESWNTEFQFKSGNTAKYWVKEDASSEKKVKSTPFLQLVCDLKSNEYKVHVLIFKLVVPA